MVMEMGGMAEELRRVRGRVSLQLALEVQAKGVAQAVVFLAEEQLAAFDMALAARPRTAATMYQDLESCFVKDVRSTTAALEETGLGLAVPTTEGRQLRGIAAGAVLARHRQYKDVPAMRTYAALGVVLGDVNEDGLHRLQAHPRVRSAVSGLQLSLVRPVASTSATLTGTTTWGIERLRVPRLWAAGYTGQGVRVGHLDTGVDGRHPALRTAVRGFLLTDADGFEVSGAPAVDTGTHGTHTAGTIAGRPVSGRHIGVAPDADLYAAAVIEGGNVVARILAGLNWCAEHDVRIVSMSLGLRGYVDAFVELMTALRSRNILPVVAVGNEGPGTSRSPGNYENVASAGAMSADNKVADFSSSDYFAGRMDPIVPSLVAPGVDVVSAYPGNEYSSSDGSSMATPHVAGLAALLWQAKPTATANEVESAIYASCELGRLPKGRANRGVPDAVRAVEQLTGRPLPAAAARAASVRRKKVAKNKKGRSAYRAAPNKRKDKRRRAKRRL